MKFELLKDWYTSPRITGEVLDCSMPMTMDTYSNCSFNCLYCFSTFQRAIGQGADDYLAKKFKKVSVARFKRYFTELDNPKNPFRDYIKNRITMQYGGLSDQFDQFEEQEGTTYEILSFLKEIKYPICFSSKSDLLLRDPKYLELFEGMQDYWSYKASIITFDEEKAKRMEAGVPSPQRRLEVLKKLSEMGIWTIIRLRPFIIGLTDLTYEELLRTAASYGVKAVSTEFFCLELRSLNTAKDKFDVMSDIVGFDIINFYKNVSSTNGYLRLNYSIKEPYIRKMQEICLETGMNFHVSDAHHKEKGCSGSCCGLPEDGPFKFSKFQFTNALQIAKKKGFVTWDDIANDNEWTGDLMILDAPGFNSGSNDRRERKMKVTVKDYMRNAWNDPKNANSPYRYFTGVMFPLKLDENQNIIYEYRPKSEDLGCANCQTKCQ